MTHENFFPIFACILIRRITALFPSKRFDGIELGGAPRRIGAEHNAHQAGKGNSHPRLQRREYKRKLERLRDHPSPCGAKSQSNGSPSKGKSHGFQTKLMQDVGLTSP
jgi:hypothetical protein